MGRLTLAGTDLVIRSDFDRWCFFIDLADVALVLEGCPALTPQRTEVPASLQGTGEDEGLHRDPGGQRASPGEMSGIFSRR